MTYYPVKFGGHRRSGSGDIMLLFATWSWRYDVTSTCLINLIWVKSRRCTCLPNLVIIGLMEIWDINSLINCYMDFLKTAELTIFICHIARFLKSRIPIYNSKVLETTGRKTRRIRRKNTGNCKGFCNSRNRKSVAT